MAVVAVVEDDIVAVEIDIGTGGVVEVLAGFNVPRCSVAGGTGVQRIGSIGFVVPGQVHDGRLTGVSAPGGDIVGVDARVTGQIEALEIGCGVGGIVGQPYP